MYNYGIYVHIPFCKARCSYCAFSSSCDYSRQPAYFRHLLLEIFDRSTKSKKISTVYFGGGTPSSVNEVFLSVLFGALSTFDLSEVSEITFECNPESVTESLLELLKSHGVNRLSFGLQSVNDATLKRIGRVHRYVDFLRAVKLAKDMGFNNISADLILGLPESFDDFLRSVDTVANLPLTHVSVYALELREDSPIYNLCKTKYNYDDDTLADMYDYAVAVLARKGFKRYEISNFAKEGYECKHNLNYWNEGRYLAFGASASGFVGNVRYTNPYDIEDYIATPIEKLRLSGDVISLNDQANEYAMLRLRLSRGVDLAEFKRRYKADFFDFFPNAAKLVKQGFICVTDNSAYVPADKLYVVNSILAELLTF